MGSAGASLSAVLNGEPQRPYEVFGTFELDWTHRSLTNYPPLMSPDSVYTPALSCIRRSLGAVWMLGLLIWCGCATSTPSQPGTAMKTSCPASIELPTVEECVKETAQISEELLRNCMRRQCRDITVTCSEWSRKRCKADSQEYGNAVLAFTLMTYHGTLHRFYPVKETYWCEEPASHGCIVKAVIHELAHSCGWDHGQGENVPGHDPEREPILECACVDENGARTSCQ